MRVIKQKSVHVHDEDYSNLLTMRVHDEDYSNLLTMRVHDEDYSRNVQCPLNIQELRRGRRGRHRMVAGFITTYAINAYHH